MTTPSTTSSTVEVFFEVAARVSPTPTPRLRRYLDRLFEGVPVEGRRMLDVGGGSGVMSFYAAARGARVLCLEPRVEGSNEAMSDSFACFADGLGTMVDVSLRDVTLQEFGGDGGEYGVVLIHNAVNHLDEDACASLHRDGAARERFRGLFDQLYALTAPGGDLIVSDCARLNLFGALRVKNPFAPDIDWRIHQQPRLWARLLADSGFAFPRIRWNMPTSLGPLGQALLGHWVGGFVTHSHFTITMRKAGRA